MSADILFEVAWKSMIVAGCVVALLIAMGRQAPANRVAVGGLGFTFLLLLPVVIVVVTSLPVPPLELAAPTTPAMVAPLLPDAAYMTAAPGDEPGFSLTQLAVTVWLGGALAMLLRLVAGLATLRRWTNRAGPVVSTHWNAILKRCQAPKGTQLLLSDEVSAPLSWGWRAPVILINPDTLANQTEAQAVLAHEAAHLARGDWPRLIAAKLVVALFWFNPFVWLLERLYLQDVEEAADAEATRLVEPAHYAQALLNVARNSAVPLGANSIASGALSKRIRKVLGGQTRSRWERTWRVGALTSVAAIAGPIAAVQFVAPAVSAAAQIMPAVTPVASIAHPASIPEPTAIAEPTPIPAAIEPSSLTGTIVIPGPAGTPVVAPMARIPAVPAVAIAAVAAQASVAAVPEVDREDIERIRRASDEIRAQSAIIARDSQRIAERARAEARVAMASSRKAMAEGAVAMEQGAIEMRRGAAEMREEARKLRDPAYRQKVIAEARANRGRWHGNWKNSVPTDQELIDAIPKMEDGARKMDEGVVKMREGAARMRELSRRQDD